MGCCRARREKILMLSPLWSPTKDSGLGSGNPGCVRGALELYFWIVIEHPALLMG